MHSSSLQSLCPSTSCFDQSSIAYYVPNNGLYFLSTNHKRPFTNRSVLLATLQNFSKTTTPLVNTKTQDSRLMKLPTEQEIEKSNLDGRICELDKIKGLPIGQSLDVIKKDYRFGSIASVNNLLMELYMGDEVDFCLYLLSDLSSSSSSSCSALEPNADTFSLLIRCYCKKDDPFEAHRVLIEMVEKKFQPNVAIFTDLINCFSKRGRMQKAFEVLQVMESVKSQPTIHTYNCLLKGLCYVGRIEEAYKMLMKIKKSCNKPDIYTYTAVMNGFCKVGRSDEALELLEEASLEMGLVPNVVTYNTLLNGYFVEGRPLEGITLLNKMKTTYCMPDYITYTTLLHGLLKWSQIHSALTIYEEMVSLGFQVEERIINTLLRGLCRRSRLDTDLLSNAYEVFDRMKSRGYVIYPCAYELVIEAFCMGKHMDMALATLHEMIRFGHSPRMITVNSVIRPLYVQGNLIEALPTLVLMHQESRMAFQFPFDMLIDECNRRGHLYVFLYHIWCITQKRCCSTQEA